MGKEFSFKDIKPIRKFNTATATNEELIAYIKKLEGQLEAMNDAVLAMIRKDKEKTDDSISREVINLEIEKRYCSKHCIVPSEEPYCPDSCPARFLKNIVKECLTVSQKENDNGTSNQD